MLFCFFLASYTRIKEAGSGRDQTKTRRKQALEHPGGSLETPQARLEVLWKPDAEIRAQRFTGNLSNKPKRSLSPFDEQNLVFQVFNNRFGKSRV